MSCPEPGGAANGGNVTYLNGLTGRIGVATASNERGGVVMGFASGGRHRKSLRVSERLRVRVAHAGGPERTLHSVTYRYALVDLVCGEGDIDWGGIGCARIQSNSPAAETLCRP